MPKQRITKEMILHAAFKLLREGGEEQLLVKNIAASLSCSVQPIYSYYENMGALRRELSAIAADFMRNYINTQLNKENLLESTGQAYISFAKDEPHLFKSYVLQNRNDINSFDDLYATEANKAMPKYLAKALSISENAAKKFHMNMMIYNMGLSLMLISTGGSIPTEQLNEKLKNAYFAFLSAAEK